MCMTLAARRTKQVRYSEGGCEHTPLSKDPSQLSVDFTIREDIPEYIEEVSFLEREVCGIDNYCYYEY